MRKIFGDALGFRQRTRKHRYIYIHADKRDRKQIRSELRYQIMPYPKGETTRHETREAQVQSFLFSSEEVSHG